MPQLRPGVQCPFNQEVSNFKWMRVQRNGDRLSKAANHAVLRGCSHYERFSTSACACNVRVVKLKTHALKAVSVINTRTVEIKITFPIDVEPRSIELEELVTLALIVEVDLVLES